MREWDQIKIVIVSAKEKFTADDAIEFLARDKLRDRELADRDDEAWPQNLEFFLHPRGTISNLFRDRNAVAPARRLPRETTNDGGEINARTDRCFVDSAKFFEPAEESLPRGMREWPFQNRLPHARRLAHDDDVAYDCAAGDRRWNHARTPSTAPQTGDMFLQ